MFLHATVQLTVVPTMGEPGVHVTLLVMSAPAPGTAITGTVVLDALLPWLPDGSLVALVFAGIVKLPAAVGVNVT